MTFNNKRFLLGLAVGLMIAAAVSSYFKSKQTTNVDQTDIQFAVRDTANVNKIFIAGKDGSRNLLERKSKTVWALNGNAIASPVLVNALLEVIRDVDMKRPLLSKERTEVEKQMAAQHLKVEIYAQNKLVRSYYVGPATVDHLGNYMLMTDGEAPYVCHIPGFEGYLDIRYRVDSIGWRTTQAYHGNSRSISSIKLEINEKPALALKRQGARWLLPDGSVPNPNKLNAYLDKYNRLFVGGWQSNKGLALTDSLLKLKPVAVLEVEDEAPVLNKKLMFYPGTTSDYHYSVLVMPQGYVGEVSKDLMLPFFTNEKEFK